MENHPDACTLTDVEVLDEHPVLGKGAYGIVYSAWWRGIEVAAKRVHDTLAADIKGANGVPNTVLKGIEDEGDTMQRLRHPHLVQFLGVYYDDLERLHIIMEKMQESLADLLERSREPLYQMKIYSIGTDIASALRYMHELPTPIAHRDLTPKNILLTADLRAKVSDLGACKYVLKLHAPMTATLAPGNPKYMPPEALDGGRYAKYAPPAVDVYSLGIVLLEMFSGADPEPSEYRAFQKCPTDPTKFYLVPEQERRSVCFSRIPKSHSLTELIVQCVDADHTQRPEMREIQEVLFGLQGKHAPRPRSKPLQRTSTRERPQHPVNGDIYDDVLSTAKANPQYENVNEALSLGRGTTPPRPPKGIRSPPATDTSMRRDGKGFCRPSQQAAKGQQSIATSPDVAVADHLGYEPLKIYQTDSEDESIKIPEDNQEYVGLVDGPIETEHIPSSSRRRAETGPVRRPPNRAIPAGFHAPWTVCTSKEVKPKGPLLPPRPNPQKTSLPITTEEAPVYDVIEDVDTVLKVTEPSKKKHIVNKDGQKLAALPVCQNELLITQDRMSGQNNVVHARNTEGKAGYIADTHVQLVNPVNFANSFSSDGTGSAGILHHLAYGKMGTKSKVLQLTSSKITKGNLETLTSLANTDVVAADKASPNTNAFFQIDFLKHRLVRLEGYLLQWTGVMGRFGHPVQWMLEMSPDGVNWKQVDKGQLKNTTKTSQYWTARQKILGRYLRISLLGTNSADNHMLCLSGIELYGDLYSSLPLDDQYAYA